MRLRQKALLIDSHPDKVQTTLGYLWQKEDQSLGILIKNTAYTSSKARDELWVAFGYVGIGMTTAPLTCSNNENWVSIEQDTSYCEACKTNCPLQVTRYIVR
jgi:hypothetical protein